MEFFISRTSARGQKPCGQAVRGEPFPSGKDRWVIEVKTLEELIALIRKEGRIVLLFGF